MLIQKLLKEIIWTEPSVAFVSTVRFCPVAFVLKARFFPVAFV
jgi:hypothetical protein